MERKDLAVDTSVALVVFAATLTMLGAGGFGDPGPDVRDLDVPGAVLAALSALPLAFRRLAPMAAYALVGLGGVALNWLTYPLDVPIGPGVAVYTLGVRYGSDPAFLRRWGAFLAASAFVPVATVAYAVGGVNVGSIGPELAGLFLIFTGLWIAGDRTRLRHERIAQLEERARRTEREAERERRLAAAEERTRIARELHDSAGHAINVILVQAGAARLLHERDPERSRQAIATVESVARDTIGEIDRLVRALRDDERPEPPPADPGAFEELVERHRVGGLRVATDVRGPRQALPHSVAWASYRILQEGLTNAARHGAGTADIAVRFESDAMEITVTNPVVGNGAPTDGGGGGHGIVGMRERATLLGGSLEAGPDHGIFRLHARLPYSEAVP